MNTKQALLIELLSAPPSATGERANPPNLNGTLDLRRPDEVAWFFVSGLFLESVLAALREQKWLIGRERPQRDSYALFLRLAWLNELQSLSFLASAIQALGDSDWRRLLSSVVGLNRAISQLVLDFSQSERQGFLRAAVAEMASLVRLVAVLEPNPHSVGDWTMAHLLYRAFDSLDESLGVEYQADLKMKRDPSERERLYEGAGLGVQTSYYSILATLENLRLSDRAHVIDLGSGYGRVGLIAGLWRDDLVFSGYEFVEHRVGISNEAARKSGISDKVRFFSQDLGDCRFEIPEADLYYMFDPFCGETYQRVLQRLLAVGRHRSVIVVTKGNAGAWVEKAFAGEGWRESNRWEGGTIRVFRSA